MSFRIYLYHPAAVNNDADVISIFTNPITGDLTATFGGLVVNGDVDIIGDINIIGQIENQYSLTNNSIVVGYDPVSLANVNNVIVGFGACAGELGVNTIDTVAIGYNVRNKAVGDTRAVFIGSNVAPNNMRSSGGMLNCVMIGYNVFASNVETDANRSVFVGARILQNLTGTTITPNATQNALVGSYIFENFNDGVGIQNNAFLGSLILSTATSSAGNAIVDNAIVGDSALTNKLITGPVTNNCLMGYLAGANASVLGSYSNFINNAIIGNQSCSDNNPAGSVAVQTLSTLGAFSLWNNALLATVSATSIVGSNAVSNNPAITSLTNSTINGPSSLSGNTLLSSVSNAVIQGYNAASSNPAMTVLANCSIKGASSLSNNTLLATVNSVFVGGYNAVSNSTSMTSLANSVILGTSALNSVSLLTTVDSCTVIGSNATISNIGVGFASFRAAIGANANALYNNTMILGMTGSNGGPQGTSVGIGTQAPLLGLLQVKQSGNSLDPQRMIYTETTNQTGVFAVSATGAQFYNSAGTLYANVAYESDATAVASFNYVIPSIGTTGALGPNSEIVVSNPVVNAPLENYDTTGLSTPSITVANSRSGVIRFQTNPSAGDLPAFSTSSPMQINNGLIKTGNTVLMSMQGPTSPFVLTLANVAAGSFTIQLYNASNVAQTDGYVFRVNYLVI